MLNPFRLIKNIIYLGALAAIVFFVINYQALLKQAEYYFYQKYPKAEVIRVILEKSPKKEEKINAENTLVIGKIGVNAPIVEVPNSNEDAIQKGLEKGVVHYPETGNPGERGNYFILGHSSDYIWRQGAYKEVFALLGKLDKGDLIKVNSAGKEYSYQVFEKVIVAESAVQILAPATDPIISLMTCWPIGTPLRRLVVRGKLVE